MNNEQESICFLNNHGDLGDHLKGVLFCVFFLINVQGGGTEQHMRWRKITCNLFEF